MKTKRKYFYLDAFEHRLLVGCLVTAWNEYIHEGKPIEDINELILKNIDAPSKKLRAVYEEERIMEKYITDERTGLKYELVGDYYFIAGDEEPEKHTIGTWGQRHLRYLKQHRRAVYTELMTSGKLKGFLYACSFFE